MPRGGSRPGSGRPKQKHPRAAKPAPARPQAAVEPVVIQPVDHDQDEPEKTPLEFMLAVMNDPGADRRERLQMAVAAAPYVHPKKGEGGKKESRAEASRRAFANYPSLFEPPRLAVANGAPVEPAKQIDLLS